MTLIGPAGTGKSHDSIALGHAAVETGPASPGRPRPDQRGALGLLLRPAGLRRPHRHHHAEATLQRPGRRRPAGSRSARSCSTRRATRREATSEASPSRYPRPTEPRSESRSPRTRMGTRSRTRSTLVTTSSPSSHPSLPSHTWTRPLLETSPSIGARSPARHEPAAIGSRPLRRLERRGLSVP